MPVARKIGPVNNGQGVSIPGSLQIAVAFYFANREMPVSRLYRGKDDKGKKVTNYGYSIRRVAKMHEVAHSVLPRAIAADSSNRAGPAIATA